MARKQLRVYKFYPGPGLTDNLLPNAWSLINANKEFIIEETIAYLYAASNAPTVAPTALPNTVSLLNANKEFVKEETAAWINRQVTNSRTVTPTSATYTPGTGQMVLEIGAHSLQIGDAVTIVENGLTFTCALDGHSTLHSYPRSTGQDPYFDKYMTVNGVTGTTITINVGISSNTSTHTFVSATTNGVTLGFDNYNYSQTVQDKCKRDIGYLIDAYVADITGGGNAETLRMAHMFYLNGSPQLLNPAEEEISHRFLKNLLVQYVLPRNSWTTLQSPVVATQNTSGAANAESAGVTKIGVLNDIIIDTINNGTGNLPAVTFNYNAAYLSAFAGYDYDTAKCRRDMTYVLDAYLYDLRYGGNSDIVRIARFYWDGAQAQIDGNRQAEVLAHQFIETLINSYIIGNHYYPRRQYGISQIVDNTKIAELTAASRVTSEVTTLVTIIQSGLTAVPETSGGAGRIAVPGKWDLNQLLMITNTTNNDIVYNFSDPERGATVQFIPGDDPEFPSSYQNSNGSTTIRFFYDTRSMSAADQLQVFVENEYMITRQNPIATDAMERQKVAAPQSMLDADFEYGLQPTKWQTISLMRNYPSVYEVPGSDISVTNLVTDASTGTGGVGASLITVSTASPHGLSAGQPITVKALANTVLGFGRAEGSFIVYDVPTTTSLRYFAKSKVGTSDGQVLASTYTQLRKGAFYTGSSLGSPTITVSTNGSSGSFTTGIIAQSGTDTIPVAGTPPPLGSPLSGTGIVLGTTVTGTNGTTEQTKTVGTNASIGDSIVTLKDASGVLVGQAIDNGSSQAIYVNAIDGNNVTLSGTITTNRIGDLRTVSGISANTETTTAGAGAVVNLTRNAGVYSATVSSGGLDYEIGDTLTFNGTEIDGATPLNNATLTVTGIIPQTSSYVNIASTNVIGTTGAGATFDIDRTSGVYSVALAQGGVTYAVNDVIRIPGTDLGGVSPANDLDMLITGVVPPTSFYNGVAGTDTSTAGNGSGAVFNLQRSNGAYSVVSIANAGTSYSVGDFIKILGSTLSGADDTNDAFIRVSTTNAGTGAITGVTISGSPVNPTVNYTNIAASSGTGGTGSGAVFTVSKTGNSYSVTVTTAGSGYVQNDVIVFPGTLFGGTAPTNNLTFEVLGVDGGGGIQGGAPSGTATYTSETFNNKSGSRQVGTGLTFNVERTNGFYSVTPNVPGQFYSSGDTHKILGTSLGGLTTANDLTVTILSVSVTGVPQSFSVTGNAVNDSGKITTFSASGVALDDGGRITSVSVAGNAVLGATIKFFPTTTISQVTTSNIPQGTTITYGAISTLQVTTASNHGLIPGDSVLVNVTSSGTNHALAAGPFFVESVPSPTTFRYTARAQGSIDSGLTGIVYARPDCFYVHRPYDGGVQLGTGGPAHGAHAVRMSKKYIRYQSGKGGSYNTGALFAPSYDLRSVTAVATAPNSFITVATDDTDHGLQPGAIVELNGIVTSGYNGEYVVQDIIDERTFRVRANTILGGLTATLGAQSQMALKKWVGATVRAGAFDDQNGIFWQYDGQTLAVGRRSSTFQVAGTISIASDSNLVTGTNTRFRDQVKAGDRVVIKGMTHVVSSVPDNTTMYVTPDYRGVVNAVNVKMMLTQDIIINQDDWNIDKCDGTGPSGYEIDISKMQMIAMQYTWYGAGFIDWMLRGPDGNYVFCHRLKGNNLNTEAYMRSGNLPVRYEVINEGPRGKLNADISNSATSLVLEDAGNFPSTGVIHIDNELIGYTGKTGNTLTGLTRAANLTNFAAGSQRNYTAGSSAAHTANTGVVFVSNTTSPIISHWGSAFMIDGGFDSDRGYIFNYQSTNVTVSTVRNTAFLIRLAPSVSNAITGDLGERELINRAQLLLQGLAISSGTAAAGVGIVVEGILNPQNYPTDPTNITWRSLIAESAGGQPSFAQIADGSSVTWSTGANVVTANTNDSRSNTSVLRFASPTVTGVKIGMTVSGPTNIQGGTIVSAITVSGANTFIYFNKTFAGTINSGTSITFTEPAYGKPGETVFSFISSPGSSNSLELDQLKELNNTPLGGRGQFPNGPDVLAVNVYLTGGTTTVNANLVLRWGEAQA